MLTRKVDHLDRFNPDMSLWCGRVDNDEGAQARRWHQSIQPYTAQAAPGVALMGFRCDAGVVRNQGRPGAKEGPLALRRALPNMASHQRVLLWDAGDVICEDDDLEQAQANFGISIATLLARGQRPIGLGGGHEMAWASWLGLAAHAEAQARLPRIGIVNFDAHFDMRSNPKPNSGTPFQQIAQDCLHRGWPFQYACFGVSEPSNTSALFDRAKAAGVQWRLDVDLHAGAIREASVELQRFMQHIDWLYMTVCLDVLPHETAPGVSAPAARGVSLEVIELLVRELAASGKLKLADIAECSPPFDINGRTAQVGARLIYSITKTWVLPTHGFEHAVA